MAKKNVSHLADLGVYGFDKVEPVVLAALVTEDPLLIIGASGTGPGAGALGVDILSYASLLP